MRQALAKGVRRDLRRAIGADALAQVEVLDRAVTILQSSVVGLQRELASLAVNHAEFKQHITTLSGATCSSLSAFSGRSFLDRFSWLFLGK